MSVTAIGRNCSVLVDSYLDQQFQIIPLISVPMYDGDVRQVFQ